MPKKPQKWGFKIWCLVCSISKYVWNFEVYCRKENANPVVVAHTIGQSFTLVIRMSSSSLLAYGNGPSISVVVAPHAPHGKAKLAHAVVMRLLEGL